MSRRGGVSGIANGTKIVGDAMETVSTCRKKPKPLDLPVDQRNSRHTIEMGVQTVQTCTHTHGIAEHENIRRNLSV